MLKKLKIYLFLNKILLTMNIFYIYKKNQLCFSEDVYIHIF